MQDIFPALLARQEAVSLAELLSALPPDSTEYEQTNKRLRLLALQMQQAGLNTDFLYHRYHDAIQQALNKINNACTSVQFINLIRCETPVHQVTHLFCFSL